MPTRCTFRLPGSEKPFLPGDMVWFRCKDIGESEATLRCLYDMALNLSLYRMEWAPSKDGPWTRVDDICAVVDSSEWTTAENAERLRLAEMGVPFRRIKDLVLEYGAGERAEANPARRLMVEDLIASMES